MPTSQQPSAAQLKALQHEVWQKAAPGYSKWIIETSVLSEVMQKYATTLQDHFGKDAAIKVLDLASASGEPALTVAKHLPNAQVVSTDLVDTYQELGRARAAAAGVQGRVTFEVADAEDLQSYADGSLDAVTCSFGLMFMRTLSAALGEIYRVLKPGGLLVVTVSKSMARMPYFKTLLDFCIGMDPESLKNTPPSIAFKFGDDAPELLDGLQAAHFRNVARSDAAGTFALPADCWWQAMLELPLPLARILAKRTQEGQEDAFGSAQSKLKEVLTQKGFFQPDGSLRIENNQCHFITAQK